MTKNNETKDTFYKAVWKNKDRKPAVIVRMAKSREAFEDALAAAGWKVENAEIFLATVTDIIKHYKPLKSEKEKT